VRVPPPESPPLTRIGGGDGWPAPHQLGGERGVGGGGAPVE